jgi:spoIIIJ-associated protein
MNSVEKFGKTLDEAHEAASKELNASKENIDYVILEAGSKGFLGLGSKPFRVSATLRFNPASVAEGFLREIFVCMGVVVEFDIVSKDKRLDITLKGDDIGVIIGKRGQTLDSLQYLVNLAVNKGKAPYVSITLDAENYRVRRKEALEKLALNLAKKVKITKKEVALEPMNPYERRVIHSALQSDKLVSTTSKGDDPYRHVVISLKQR